MTSHDKAAWWVLAIGTISGLAGLLGQTSCGKKTVTTGADVGAPTTPGQPGEISACEGETNKLNSLHTALQSCNEDTDCNYVDGFYKVVDRVDLSYFVTTFDCQAVTPFLVVANGVSVKTRFNELAAVQKAQAQACARPPDVVTCLAFKGFTSTTPPACQNAVCVSTVTED